MVPSFPKGDAPMLKTLFAAACLFVAASAFADANPNETTQEFKTTTQVQCTFDSQGQCSKQCTIFRCDATQTGQCYFMVMGAQCGARKAAGGDDEEVCEVHKLDQFSLKAGDSKTVADLPLNFSHCADKDPIDGLQGCFYKRITQH